MEYASQLANIANVQNYAAQFKDTRLASLKHPGEFFDYQKVSPMSQVHNEPQSLCVFIGTSRELLGYGRLTELVVGL
jgi:hypothetical protein